MQCSALATNMPPALPSPWVALSLVDVRRTLNGPWPRTPILQVCPVRCRGTPDPLYLGQGQTVVHSLLPGR